MELGVYMEVLGYLTTGKLSAVLGGLPPTLLRIFYLFNAFQNVAACTIRAISLAYLFRIIKNQ